jgi:hypothetical protein
VHRRSAEQNSELLLNTIIQAPLTAFFSAERISNSGAYLE